jgi:hypothetical protein
LHHETPNARHELLPEAGARDEPTLEAVSCTPWFGWGHPVGRLRVECSLSTDSDPTVILADTHAATRHKTHYKPIGSPRPLGRGAPGES